MTPISQLIYETQLEHEKEPTSEQQTKVCLMLSSVADGVKAQAAHITALECQVVALREAMLSVLCDPEGKCCISGSNGDRKVIDDALALTAESFAGKCVVDADRLKYLESLETELHLP